MNTRWPLPALALLMLAQAAPPTAPALTRTPAEQLALTRGRTLMQEFLAVKLDNLWGAFTPEVRAQWGTLDGFQAFRKTGISQYGAETQLVRERTFMQGKEAVYVRSSIYQNAPEQVWAFVVGFEGGRVTTFGVLLEEERTNDPVALR